MDMQNLIIVGAGQFGREVFTWAVQAIRYGAPWNIKGFLDSRPAILAGYDYPVPILAAPENYRPQADDVFLCAMGDPRAKQRYSSLIAAQGGTFATLIHPTALIGWHIEIGAGSIICPFTQLSCDIRLGEHVTFGTHSSAAHDTVIGDFSQISGACQLNGRAKLDEGVFLGSHATILPEAHVGAWSHVGAHSVVLKKVAPYDKVFGVPAITIGTTRPEPKAA
ncbi:MAG: NeuD/PglB/VioB family sugar acetyltransferase [Planctomycetia bacterium]|nr:NeuD/PglB/VioB family sugar acetyltransferase [Planctomycetia bacterium]